jgi:hypothetical protein
MRTGQADLDRGVLIDAVIRRFSDTHVDSPPLDNDLSAIDSAQAAEAAVFISS